MFPSMTCPSIVCREAAPCHAATSVLHCMYGVHMGLYAQPFFLQNELFPQSSIFVLYELFQNRFDLNAFRYEFCVGCRNAVFALCVSVVPAALGSSCNCF